MAQTHSARDLSLGRLVGFCKTRGVDLLLNIVLLAVLWFAYAAVRGVTSDNLAQAMNNASSLLRFQSEVGLPSELAIQESVIDRTGVLRAANFYYIAFHFPVVLGFLGWVWLRHRSSFARIRNVLIGVSSIGLVLHMLYPLAPPRMIGAFTDTAAELGPNPYEMEISSSANQIAAMPSLHVAWALIVAIGIVWILDSPWRYLAILHAVLTVAVVVVTANHYITDAIVGSLLVAAVWMLSRSAVDSSDKVPVSDRNRARGLVAGVLPTRTVAPF